MFDKILVNRILVILMSGDDQFGMEATMKMHYLLATTALIGATIFASPAFAHCDTLDGPVVSAARKALDSGNINYALVWIKKDTEKELRNVFEKALAVRKAGGQARELADMYFFETLVRIHRAGEGAPYTGLKPAGHVEPPVVAADKAMETGNLDNVGKLISERMQGGLHKHFEQLMAKKRYDPNDIEAGRAFSNAYVEYVHYVERLYNAAETLAPDVPGGHHH